MTDISPDTAELLKALSAMPALVTTPKDVAIAEDLIAQISRMLGAGPASRPAVHPRPKNAGVYWEKLSDESQIKYDAVVDELASETPHLASEQEKLQEATVLVRKGLDTLSESIQQPMAGMVQRHS